MHLCKYWYHGSASTSSGSPSRIYQCMYLWCNTSCGSIGSATTGGGQEKGTECICECKKKEGVLKEVKQQGQQRKNATYVVLWVQSDAKNAKIGQGCKIRWEMNIALH